MVIEYDRALLPGRRKGCALQVSGLSTVRVACIFYIHLLVLLGLPCLIVAGIVGLLCSTLSFHVHIKGLVSVPALGTASLQHSGWLQVLA